MIVSELNFHFFFFFLGCSILFLIVCKAHLWPEVSHLLPPYGGGVGMMVFSLPAAFLGRIGPAGEPIWQLRVAPASTGSYVWKTQGLERIVTGGQTSR